WQFAAEDAATRRRGAGPAADVYPSATGVQGPHPGVPAGHRRRPVEYAVVSQAAVPALPAQRLVRARQRPRRNNGGNGTPRSAEDAAAVWRRQGTTSEDPVGDADDAGARHAGRVLLRWNDGVGGVRGHLGGPDAAVRGEPVRPQRKPYRAATVGEDWRGRSASWSDPEAAARAMAVGRALRAGIPPSGVVDLQPASARVGVSSDGFSKLGNRTRSWCTHSTLTAGRWVGWRWPRCASVSAATRPTARPSRSSATG